jgi:hypothetical protein
MKAEKLTFIQRPYLLPLPGVRDLQRCHTDSIVQPRMRVLWAQRVARHFVPAIRTTASKHKKTEPCFSNCTISNFTMTFLAKNY